MFIQHLGATGVYDITDGDESYISCVEFTVYGFTGSMVPQTVQMTDGPVPSTITPVYYNASYVNADTGAYSPAGTAITANGRYLIDTSGAKLALNVTDAGDADFYVFGKPLAGTAVGASGSGSGTSTTALAVATAAAPTYAEGSSDALSMDLAGNLRTIDETPVPSTPLPTYIQDSTGSNSAAVKPASTAPAATDPAVVVAISPNQFVANNSTQANASLSWPVYSITTAKNSGVCQPVSTAGRVGAGDTGNNSMSVGAVRFNSSTWDPEQNNVGGTALASAARTTTAVSSDLINYNGRGVHVTLNVTASSSGSITLNIEGKDPVSNAYYTILTAAAVTGTGITTYRAFPGATAAANLTANDIMPRTWRVNVVANNANSMTYSVGYSLVV